MLSPYQDDEDSLTALRKATGINQPSSASPIAGPQPLMPSTQGRELNDAMTVPGGPKSIGSDGTIGSAAAPAPPAGGGGGAPSTTFAQLQASGIARPAPPPAAPAPMPGTGQQLNELPQGPMHAIGDNGAISPGSPSAPITPQQLGGSLGYAPPQPSAVMGPTDDGSVPPTGAPTGGGGPAPVMPPATPVAPPPVDQPPPGAAAVPPEHPTDDPNSPGGTAQNGENPTPPPENPPPPPADNPPPSNTGNTGNGNNNGGNNQTPGKYPLQDEIEAALKKALGQPSAYDDAAFQNDVSREYNKIDDQYALDQKGLTDELGQRGLGTSNDSSIGLGRMSDLNVGRKSARETVLSNLSSQRARSQSDDLARVLGLATTYGQGTEQLSFEQQMAIATLLAQLGYKPGQGVGG